jgi:hypothetical protein
MLARPTSSSLPSATGMGCYGHSRLTDLLFGGATRHILRHMTIPVLMSH